jgi:hypothetical protein
MDLGSKRGSKGVLSNFGGSKFGKQSNGNLTNKSKMTVNSRYMQHTQQKVAKMKNDRMNEVKEKAKKDLKVIKDHRGVSKKKGVNNNK